MSLRELANHNPDIQRLLDKGYALRLDSSHLVVRDVPYLDSEKALKRGAFVTVLEYIDTHRVKQHDHQVYFAGGVPHGINGNPIPNLGGGSVNVALSKNDVHVERSFSNKPTDGRGGWIPYPDFFEKIESYVRVVSGPAIELHNVTPLTRNVDWGSDTSSVFNYPDTLTSRAGITDLTDLFDNDVVALIGLGGTGAHLLDSLVKTRVREIRGFDGDYFHVHNAFRSPGKLDATELGRSKADVYQRRYESFRQGLVLKHMPIHAGSADEFAGVTFAFVCVDKGLARSEIFDLLISLNIPFIDVGMGLHRTHDKLTGTLRTTTYSADNAKNMRAKGYADMADHPEDEYRKNVQIGELNALNAALAIIRFKQLRGFYYDEGSSDHLLFDLQNLKLFAETGE